MNYSIFFDSVKQFVEKTDARGNVSISGLNLGELNGIEQKLQRPLPTYLKEYLSYFGEEFTFYSQSHHEYVFSGKTIRQSLSLFNEYQLKEILANVKAEDVEGFIPLYFDETRAQMILLKPMSDMGEMCRVSELYLGKENEVYDPEDIEITPYLSFFQNLRERLFLEIKHAFYPNRKSEQVDLSEISWAKFHVYYHREKHESYNIGFSRKDFLKEVSSQKSDEILSINDYEVLFIRYLLEVKGVPPIPEVYDPYGES